MKNTKRVANILGLLLFIFSIVLAGCSNQSSSQAPSQSGQQSQPADSNKKYSQGVTDTTITVGTWGPQTGPAASFGLLGKGMDAYFKYINEKGGINGRKIELKFYNDEYQPSKTVAAAKKLVEEDKVFAIVGTVGTAPNLAARDYLIKQGIPVVSLPSGAGVFVNPVVNNYFISQPNYRSEGKLMAQYAVEKLGKKKIGVLYQNDDLGKDYLAGVEDFAKGKGMELAVKSTYNPTDVDYSSSALKMKEAGVDVVILCTIPKPGAAFAKELRKLGVNVELITDTMTGSDPQVMIKMAGDAWTGAISTGFGPTPTEDTPAVKAFREAWKKAYPNENEFSRSALVGWMNADILAEAIKRCGDNLTWDNLIAQLHTFKGWSGDYAKNITYTPEDHSGVKAMYFMQIKDGTNVKISDDIPLE